VQYTDIRATWYNETTNSYVNQTLDLSGGFFNDGEVGPVKLTWNIALTTSMLAWSMLEYKESYWAANSERKNLVSSVLRHGAAYVSETYVVNPLRNPEDPTRPAAAGYDLLYFVVCYHWVPPQALSVTDIFYSSAGHQLAVKTRRTVLHVPVHTCYMDTMHNRDTDHGGSGGSFSCALIGGARCHVNGCALGSWYLQKARRLWMLH
jgi:hypothetical protein